MRIVRPPVWRRFVVPSDISLSKLHHILQAVMGWTDSHLYGFTAGRTSYGEPGQMPDLRRRAHGKARQHPAGERVEAPLRVRLRRRMGARHRRRGDLGARGRRAVPPCVAGSAPARRRTAAGRTGTPELLEALADPKHPEHEEKLDWIGDGFDPETFDFDEVNALLRRIR